MSKKGLELGHEVTRLFIEVEKVRWSKEHMRT